MLLRSLFFLMLFFPFTLFSVAEAIEKEGQKVQTMHFMSRSVGVGEFEYEPLEKTLFQMIYVALAPEFDADLFKTTLGRGISLIENEGDYCSYNILKNPQRAKAMLFSHFPSSIYPKRKLFFVNPELLIFSQTASLASLSAHHKIGLVAQAYLGALNYSADVNRDNLVFIEGINSHQQLVNMLMKERLDFIVEYQSVVDTYLLPSDIQPYSINISEYETNEAGYFVCSQSKVGEKVIGEINQLYHTPAFQKWLKDYHYQHFSEAQAVELLSLYQTEYGLNWLESP